ncbi:MAG: hypothetical protein GW900_00510 [Gammaproteobacteria bacterium]|nr:hypothetical protein [Gammaproteobacteria bacterium]
MKGKIAVAVLAGGALLSLAGVSVAQETPVRMLEITEIGVKIGHEMKFRVGVKAYLKCYGEKGGEGSWSTWRNVDGSGTSYHVVSSRSGWAELGKVDAARESCWPMIEEQVAPHMESVSTRFARHMPDWSGTPGDDNTVVRLHQFRVEDGKKFREVVGAVTAVMKESKYPHLGSWYDVLGNSSNEADYFVVAYYKDFAAMDEDRQTAYEAVKASAGEQRADALWEDFGDSLTDDWDYFTMLLHRDDELSRMTAP